MRQHRRRSLRPACAGFPAALRLLIAALLSEPFDPEELRARVRVVERMIELLASVKRLRRLLPTCSCCKWIRDDRNYWEQVERYSSEHTDLRFSHGICPACYAKAMADLGAAPVEPDKC